MKKPATTSPLVSGELQSKLLTTHDTCENNIRQSHVSDQGHTRKNQFIHSDQHSQHRKERTHMVHNKR